MMRVSTCFLVFLVVVFASCTNHPEDNISTTTNADTVPATSESPLQTIFTDTTLNDTLFLYRETNTTEYYHYHAIYIDTNHHSREYNRLTDFKFGVYEDDFQSNYKSIKERSPNGYKVKNKTSLPKNWLPIYKYKSNYYLYSPSEGGYHGRLIINDSSWVDWGMEGPFPLPFQAITQKTKRHYSISLEEPFSQTPEYIEITILDSKTKLSLFETTTSNEPPKRYELYVPVEYAHHFAMIVNHMDNGKTPDEFKFDDIDSVEMQKALLLK